MTPRTISLALALLFLPGPGLAAGNLTETGYHGIPYDKISDAQLKKAAEEALHGRTLGGAAFFTRGALDAPNDPELAKIAQAVRDETARRATEAKSQSLEDSAWIKEWRAAKNQGGKDFYEKYKADRLASKQENAGRYADLQGLADQLEQAKSVYRGGSYRTFLNQVASETMAEDGVSGLASPGAVVKNGWKVVLHDSYVNSLMERGVPAGVAEGRWNENMDAAVRDNLSRAAVEGMTKDVLDQFHAEPYLELIAQKGSITPEVSDKALEDIQKTAVEKSMDALEKGLPLDAGTARTPREIADLNAKLKGKGFNVEVGFDGESGKYTLKKTPGSLERFKDSGAGIMADTALGLADAATMTSKLSAIAKYSDQPFIDRVRLLKEKGYSGQDIADMLYGMDKKARLTALGMDKDLRESLASRNIADLASQAKEVERVRSNLALATGKPVAAVDASMVKQYLEDRDFRAQMDSSRQEKLKAQAQGQLAAVEPDPAMDAAVRDGLAQGGVKDRPAQDKALENIVHGLATAQGKKNQEVAKADVLRYVTDTAYRDAMKKAYQVNLKKQAADQQTVERIRAVLAKANYADGPAQDKVMENIMHGLATAQGKKPLDVSKDDVLRYITDKNYRDAMKKAYQANLKAQAGAGSLPSQTKALNPPRGGQGGSQAVPPGTAPSQDSCDEKCQALKDVNEIMERVGREAGPILGNIGRNQPAQERIRDKADTLGVPLNTQGK